MTYPNRFPTVLCDYEPSSHFELSEFARANANSASHEWNPGPTRRDPHKLQTRIEGDLFVDHVGVVVASKEIPTHVIDHGIDGSVFRVATRDIATRNTDAFVLFAIGEGKQCFVSPHLLSDSASKSPIKKGVSGIDVRQTEPVSINLQQK